MRPLRSLFVALAFVPSVAFAAPQSEQDPRGLAELGARQPDALELVNQADLALAHADNGAALALLEQAATLAPKTALIERARCGALNALGRRSAALAACDAAIAASGRAPLDLRARVGALMAGEGSPSMADASEAYALAREVSDFAPRQPWGYAAFCDVARRIGDPALWASSVHDLERVAPDHFETRAALARSQQLRAWWPLKCVGWVLLLAFGLGSTLHWLLRTSTGAPLNGQAAGRGPGP
ncbi:MAG TPA: hypothetical protein VGM29_09275 [Polyangiaceae bacterium]|jgi:tetratricopeptide (TPR) repeat protein